MSDGAFPKDKTLTAIAIGYSNPDNAMVADKVLPRAPVGTEDFEWTKYPTGQAFTVPNTRVGNKGAVPRVEISGEKASSSTESEGLEIPLTKKDIDNAPKGVDPKGLATELATKLLLLRREIRVAELVLDANQYAAANKKNLATLDAGAHAWDLDAAEPLVDIRAWINGMMMRANRLVMGPDAWEALSAHPKVVSAALGNDGTNGFASKERVAQLLDIAEIIVGAGWVNASKPGQDVSLTRVWGAHCLAFYSDSTASFQTKAVTFGLTAQLGTRVAGSKEVDMGLHGGTVVRAGEDVKELIIAPDCGLLIQNVLGA